MQKNRIGAYLREKWLHLSCLSCNTTVSFQPTVQAVALLQRCVCLSVVMHSHRL